MTFDLILTKGFAHPVIITVDCEVDIYADEHRYQRIGAWKIKPPHQSLHQFIAKRTNGVMYSVYSSGCTWVICYNDNLLHNPFTCANDPALAFALDDAPMDDSYKFKYKLRGDLEVVHPSTGSAFDGRWSRWAEL